MSNDASQKSSRKILLYGDMNLNLLDGSAIWLVSMAQCLATTGSEVTLLLKAPVSNDRLISPLLAFKNIKIVNPFVGRKEYSDLKSLTPRLAGREILRLDRAKPFDLVIARGSRICDVLAKGGNIDGKFWPYITDLPESASEYSEQLKSDLKTVALSAKRMFVQTEHAKVLMEEVLPVSRGKLVLLNPMIPDEFFVHAEPNQHTSGALKMVYVGKFHRDWRTYEMVDIPRTLGDRGIKATVTFIGDKVQASPLDPTWSARMKSALENPPAGVMWLGGMSRAEAIEEMRSYDVGLGWRTDALNDSPEISTKLLEYCAVGLPPIVNRTAAHEKLLTKRYPLFVDRSVEETLEKISENPHVLEEARLLAQPASKFYSISASAKRLEQAMTNSRYPAGPGAEAGQQGRENVETKPTESAFSAELKLEGFTSRPQELYQHVKDVERERTQLAGEASALKREAQTLRSSLLEVQTALGSLGTLATKVDSALSPKSSNKHPVPAKKPQSAPAAASTAVAGSEHGQLEVIHPSAIQLLDRFSEASDSRSLELAIDRLWLDGEIFRPASLLDANLGLVAGMSPRGRRISGSVRGTRNVAVGELLDPARSSGPAYVPVPSRTMYCVHAAPPYNSNGYATRTQGIASGLHAAGEDVVVVGRVGYPWDSTVDIEKPDKVRQQVDINGVSYVYLPDAHLHNDPLDVYIDKATDAIVHEARRTRPSVIQAASNYLTALPALLAARRLGVPFVYEVRGLWEISHLAVNPGWEHTERFQLQVELERYVVNNSDRVLAITRQVAEELVSRGAAEDRIDVLPNGVNPSEFAPLLRDSHYANLKNISADVPVIGFAGSIVEYEGLDTLLDAAGLLKDRGVQFEVYIAGDGRDLKRLRELALDRGLMDVVTFGGRLPAKEIPRLLSTFSIVTCPRHSLRVTELVSPLKPLEAMGAGRATLLSDVAPHVDIAGADQARAMLFRSGDAEDMADALERLIKNEEIRNNLARTARLWTVDERDWSKLGLRAVASHQMAISDHEMCVDEKGSRKLGELRIAVIADSPQLLQLKANFQTVILSKDDWCEQLSSGSIDAVVIQSAWNGNDGEWSGALAGVEATSALHLSQLLTLAGELGIRTIFWNTQDGIYPKRFLHIAPQVDVVFTADASLIPVYRGLCRSTATIASMTPSADESFHNPLSRNRTTSQKVGYAGLRFNVPFKSVETELSKVSEVLPEGSLEIFGRGARFAVSNDLPAGLRRGARSNNGKDTGSQISSSALVLSKSLVDSPTVIPEEVILASAIGLPQVSMRTTEALARFFGDSLTVSDDHNVWEGAARVSLRDNWKFAGQVLSANRVIMRAHLAKQVFALFMRTAGIPVRSHNWVSIVAVRPSWSKSDLERLLEQTIRPKAIFGDVPDPNVVSAVAKAGIELLGVGTDLSAVGEKADWMLDFSDSEMSATHIEDLWNATLYCGVDQVRYKPTDADQWPELLSVGRAPIEHGTLVRTSCYSDSANELATASIFVSMEKAIVAPVYPLATPQSRRTSVLIAGHDLKFVGGVQRQLEAAGYEILRDEWQGHDTHDVARSQELLKEANIVFCEWGLGNTVWYSRNLRAGQRLFVRVHSQELFVPYLSRADQSQVERFIFVSAHIRDQAIRDHGLDPKKCVVVPNTVPMHEPMPSTNQSRFTLGLVGIIPKLKRVDRALDIVQILHDRDERFNLRIRSRLPSDYPWMQRRPKELEWYNIQLDRARNELSSVVQFDEFGPDMGDWYARLGFALSVSDFEAMHSTLPDAAGAGVVPVGLVYPGADRVFPREWLHATVDEMADYIWELSNESAKWNNVRHRANLFVKRNYSEETIGNQLIQLLRGE